MKNDIVLITGSLGLIGFESVNLFLKKGYRVIGIDNNQRSKLFNIETNYATKLQTLYQDHKKEYTHYSFDIRDSNTLSSLFKQNKNRIKIIIHTAAQTSHDWSKLNPITDFEINTAASVQLLELARIYCPKTVFIYTSTNKVYGDLVNKLPLQEREKRYDLDLQHKYYYGISEKFPIDHSIHSPFGVSKLSTDIYVQEYGKYYNMNTGIFRLGVITGQMQSGSLYQGFIEYLVRQIKESNTIRLIGYEGKQVRDILHAKDVANAFFLFSRKPKNGEVYNLGGGRKNSISLLELIHLFKQKISSNINVVYDKEARTGDHKWWITNTEKFESDFLTWKPSVNYKEIIEQVIDQ